MLLLRSFLSRLTGCFVLALLLVSVVAPSFALAQTTPPAPTPSTPAPTTPTTPPAATPATTPPPTEAVPGSGGETTPSAPRPFRPIAPRPAVPIPGVRFSSAIQEEGLISIPYLAQYISGIYRLSVGLGAILAAIMIVYGGFRYLLAASLPDVKDGKEIISDAIIGLVVLLTSYLILKTINPALVTMNPIRVDRIAAQPPMVQGNYYTGPDDPSEISDTYGGQGQCGSQAAGGAPGPMDTGTVTGPSGRGSIVTYDGVPFFQLPMRGHYLQFRGPWANLEYGPGLLRNAPVKPCRGLPRLPPEATPEQRRNRHYEPSGCWTTFAAAACGPVAFAEVMAYYGVMVSDPGSDQMARNARVYSHGGDTLHSISASQIATLSQRTQRHLFDPIDSAKKALRDHNRGHNSGTGSGFMNWPGFETIRIQDRRGSERAARVAQAIQSGYPVIFLCGGCIMKARSLSGPDKHGGGHWMVFDGVSNNGRWFHVTLDGGGGGAGGRFVAASNIGNHIDLYLVKPVAGGYVQQQNTPAQEPAGSPIRPCNTSNDGPGAPLGSTGGRSSTPRTTVTGEVARAGFSYAPSRASADEGWGSPSQLFFPTRLREAFRGSGSRPQVHLYIYIHGQNSHHVTADDAARENDSYPVSLQRALAEVAGSKNVVIAAPHYLTNLHSPSRNPYMNRLDLLEFYNGVAAALARSDIMPGFRPSDIASVVVGGHSQATCQGSDSKIFLGNTTAFPVPLKGIVAYDGCLGDSFGPRRGTPVAPAALYLNPDISGMGIDRDPDPDRLRYPRVREAWNLCRTACPSYVENQCPMPSRPEGRPVECRPSAEAAARRPPSCNACYGKVDNGREIISFETHYGHKMSVFHMTRYMLQAFY